MKNFPQSSIKPRLKAKATELGIVHLGITDVRSAEHYPYYIDWTEKGFAGEMWYLTENNRKEKRESVQRVFPRAKTALVAAFSYKPSNNSHATNAKFARYGWGKDYHLFVKEKLQQLIEWLETQTSEKIHHRIYVDTGPILEKNLAERSGMGWIGKNTCLINPKFGSYLLIGEILIDMKLESDNSSTQHCGTCTRCLDACPTQAFVAPFQLDATRCISYHTIENKNLEIPEHIAKKLNGWVAGCDICQEVCPWNHKAPATTLQELTPGPHTHLTLEKIMELTQEQYDEVFAATSFKRIPLAKLKANAALVLKNQKSNA